MKTFRFELHGIIEAKDEKSLSVILKNRIGTLKECDEVHIDKIEEVKPWKIHVGGSGTARLELAKIFAKPKDALETTFKFIKNMSEKEKLACKVLTN